MNKSEAIKRLDAIEKEQAELRKIIEAPELPKRAGCFGFVPEAGSGEEYIALSHSMGSSAEHGLLRSCVDRFESMDTNQNNYKGLFWKPEDKQNADNFADALNVFIELRTLDGVKSFGVDGDNWYFWHNYSDDKLPLIVSRRASGGMLVYYETREHAQAAIETIGEERLKKAFRVLGGSVE